VKILQVFSDENEPKVLCSVVEKEGQTKDILQIELRDNGLHIYKRNMDDEDHYILPPVPEIDSLVKEIIEEVADELSVEAIVYKYGQDNETEDLVLAGTWHDLEKLALAASKHAAVSADVESKVIIGIVKFSNFIQAATLLRKEDSFPIMQVFVDFSTDPHTVKLYNEMGQLIENRRENVNDFEEYVKGLTNEEDSVIVYRESIGRSPSPTEVKYSNGETKYVGVIFKYIIGFNPEDSSDPKIKNKRRLSTIIRGTTYLDRLSEGSGVEVMIGNPITLDQLVKETLKIKRRIQRTLSKLGIQATDINYFGADESILKEIKDSNPWMLLVPIGFLVVGSTKKEFDEFASRIVMGPTPDGMEILDEEIKSNLSNMFVGYLASLEEALILYNDIDEEVSKDE
jgi:hypothetical protein